MVTETLIGGFLLVSLFLLDVRFKKREKSGEDYIDMFSATDHDSGSYYDPPPSIKRRQLSYVCIYCILYCSLLNYWIYNKTSHPLN